MRKLLKKFLAIALGVVGVVSLFSGTIRTSKINVSATKHDEYICEEADPQVFYDVAEGAAGSCYKEEGLVTYGLDDKNKCNDIGDSHGKGHEKGGITLLDKGCRNYRDLSYNNGKNYGSSEILYWINTASMQQIADETYRNQVLADIRMQIALWNEVVMHDGTGQIVNIREVNPDATTKLSKIDEREIIEVLLDSLDYTDDEGDHNLAGRFDSSNYTVALDYDSGVSGWNVDTVMHEFGHVLGLNDLDKESEGILKGTHETLMGYSRGTSKTNLTKAITYPDIQGVAVTTGRHVCKDSHFMRYVKQGDKYLHICFYCDRINSENYVMSGSQPVVDKIICAHQYEPMVSSGSQSWVKCVKCYKVVEEHQIKAATL